jgi:hypothetical protein
MKPQSRQSPDLLSRFVRRLAAVLCLAAPLLVARMGTCAEPTLAAKGDVLYTRFTLFYENNEHKTVNYRRGTLLPINTQVVFIRSDKENIFVKLPDDTKLRIANIPKWTGDDIARVFNRTFGKDKVDLSSLAQKDRDNILAGTVDLGMAKEVVLKAMGYPPEFRTPTLEENQWRYWKNRFGTMLVYFTDGKVSKIVR